MTCDDARDLLDSVAADRSDEALPPELKAHLEGCEPCRAGRRRGQDVLRRLDAAREGLVDLRPRFEDVAARALRETLNPGRQAGPVMSPWTRALAAASLLLIVLPTFWLLFRKASEVPGAMVARQQERIWELIELLKDPSPEVRAKAQEEIVDLGPAAARIVKAARDKASDPEARSRLARIAAILRCQEILGNDVGRRLPWLESPAEKLKVLVTTLESRSPRPLKEVDQADLREEILRNAGREDLLRLIDLYADPRGKNAPWEDVAVAQEYAWILTPLLAHQDSEVVLGVVTALGHLASLPWVRTELSKTALSARIAELLGSKNLALRLAALEALGKVLNAESEAPRIVALLRDPDARIRRAAIQSLGALNNRKFIPDVVRALTDPDATVQVWAVDVLKGWKVADCVEDLAPLLDSRDSDVRSHVMVALGELGARKYAPRMAQALAEKSSPLRIGAIKGLRSLRAVEYLPDIAAQLKDQDGFLRALVLDTLGAFGAKERVGDVEEALKDPDDMVRVFAAETLARFSVPSSKGPLERALQKEKNPEVQDALKTALQRLRQAEK